MKKPSKKRVIKKYITREEYEKANIAFLFAIERAIKFHRENTFDPYNIGTSVSVALGEVRDAFKAYVF